MNNLMKNEYKCLGIIPIKSVPINHLSETFIQRHITLGKQNSLNNLVLYRYVPFPEFWEIISMVFQNFQGNPIRANFYCFG